MSVPRFEAGNTVQFTWVSSVAPDAAPNFAVVDGRTGLAVQSGTSIQSNTTAYYALFTMPGSDGYFVGEWLAQKTVSGSAHDFRRRFGFKAEKTVAIT